MKLSLNNLTRNQLALLAFTIWIVPYFLLNQLTVVRSTFAFQLPFEQSIPFMPAFVYAYALVWIFVLLPYFFIKDDANFYRAIKAYLAVMCISYAVFLLVPGKIVWPTFEVNGITTGLVALIQTLDQPYNLLPSLHVSLAFLSAFVCFYENKKRGRVMLFVAFIISASTLFIKQHYFLDVFTGLLLASGAYYYFFLREGLKQDL